VAVAGKWSKTQLVRRYLAETELDNRAIAERVGCSYQLVTLERRRMFGRSDVKTLTAKLDTARQEIREHRGAIQSLEKRLASLEKTVSALLAARV
jgi:chromosome segregation ATPase